MCTLLEVLTVVYLIRLVNAKLDKVHFNQRRPWSNNLNGLDLKPLPSENEHSVWQTEAHFSDITCKYTYFQIKMDVWFFFFFYMHWQDNMCKPENDMSQYILLTFYYSILFGILLRTNEKEFRVHIIYWKNSLSVYIYLCLLHVVFTVRVLVPVGIPYSFRRYPDNETGSYIHHAVHETWYDGHWSRQHCSSQLCDQ